jgi:hypothetical protein
MNTTQTLVYGMCLLGVFLAYQEYPDQFVLFWTKLRLYCLNAYMFLKARQMHWQISKEASKMGVALPPFHFVPLWERD